MHTLAMTVVTILRTAPASGGPPSRPANSRCPAPISADASAEAVTALPGVRNVWNDLEISYGIDPVEVDLHVQEALDRSALVSDGSDVTAGNPTVRVVPDRVGSDWANARDRPGPGHYGAVLNCNPDCNPNYQLENLYRPGVSAA